MRLKEQRDENLFYRIMSLDEARAALALASLSLPQCTVTTPMSQSMTRHTWEGAQYENCGQPLIYVGVTMERPESGWGIMTLFNMSHYLVVGGIQQESMQAFTSWAWATTAPPRATGVDFRSSFGPLFPTSLLQLVPGDVILSINGHSQFDSIMWHSRHLNILAVRQESARRAAHQVLSMATINNAEYNAARVAFEMMEPLLLRTAVPKACQRQLFPEPHSVTLQIQTTQVQGVFAHNVENEQTDFTGKSRANLLVRLLVDWNAMMHS